MADQPKSVRGMSDILPGDSPVWQYLEEQLRRLMSAFCYREIRMPLVEPSELFSRGIGAGTDIIEKEMYTFADRKGESLSLRPEATAGCVRAGLQHGLLYNQVQKLWTMGPMFRYERPQKGRYRQFHQFSVETFGVAGPEMDAELVLLVSRLWQGLGLDRHVRLELNTLGSQASRQAYRNALSDYLGRYEAELDADSQRRLALNPLRILDSKNSRTQEIVAGAPALHDYLDPASLDHFTRFRDILDQAGIEYTINQRLVRGLDYYNNTVFEWITDTLGAQGTVCGGGRYDALVELLGGKPTPAVGFAIGLERLIMMLEAGGLVPAEVSRQVDVSVVTKGDGRSGQVLLLVEKIRNALPTLRVQVGSGGYQGQMKRALTSGADYVLVAGESELSADQLLVRSLNPEGWQETMTLAEVLELFRKNSMG